MTTQRAAAITAVCLAFALLPTVLHTYAGLRADDGATASAIPPRLADRQSRPTERRAEWVERTFASGDWIERRYTGTDQRSVLLFVARSYDAKRLYHHPELAVAHGYDLHNGGMSRLPGLGDAPVHVLRAHAPDTGLALYALLHDGAFVGDPYWFQLRAAWSLLLSPRRAMTLFFVHDPEAAADSPVDRSPAGQVLAAAIESFRRQAVATP